MYRIYLRRTPDGKVYIGCTSVSLEARAKLGYGQTDFQKAIVQFGWDSIQSEILAETDDKEQARRLEQQYIEQYDATNPDKGYNRKGSGFSMSEPRRIQMSKNTKAYWKNPEHIAKMKDAIAESRRSPEYRKKVSDAIKKKWKTGDYAERVANSMRERNSRPEVKAMLSERSRSFWSDAEHRQEQSERMKQVMSRPDVHANLVESRKKIDWHSDAMRAGRKACAEANRGKVGIHKIVNGNVQNKKVYAEQLDSYLEDGWVLGFVTKGPGIAISRYENGTLIKKRTSECELDAYLAQGWKKGWKG